MPIVQRNRRITTLNEPNEYIVDDANVLDKHKQHKSKKVTNLIFRIYTPTHPKRVLFTLSKRIFNLLECSTEQQQKICFSKCCQFLVSSLLLLAL